MSYQSYAEYYHELTKYTPTGIASNQQRLDFSNQPIPFKKYPNKKSIDLSCFLPLGSNPFSDAGIKNPKDYTKDDKSLAVLSKLLYLSNGITAMIPYPDRPFYMRAAPSAGGLYPTEIYLCTDSYPGLEDGIYNYQIDKQSITLINAGSFKQKVLEACFNHPAILESNLILILSSVFHRSSWRYQDRAYRRICLDTGHVIGNINLVSNISGFKPTIIGGFNDRKINEILFLEEAEEQVLAVVAEGNPQSQSESAFSNALPSRLESEDLKTPEGFRLIELHNRSRIENHVDVPNIVLNNVEEKFKFSSQILFSSKPKNFNWKETLLPTILKRRSTRAFSGESITQEELGSMLCFTYSDELFPSYFDTSLLQTFVAVNNINGLEDGCYFYSPGGNYLRQVRFKNFRDEIYYLCLGQELGHKASAVIFHTCDLSKAVFKYGERAYRYLHMDAGQLGQRLNLAAINMDLGVSGIGGFFDDQVNDLLGIPEHEAVIYITTLGVPVKSNT